MRCALLKIENERVCVHWSCSAEALGKAYPQGVPQSIHRKLMIEERDFLNSEIDRLEAA